MWFDSFSEAWNAAQHDGINAPQLLQGQEVALRALRPKFAQQINPNFNVLVGPNNPGDYLQGLIFSEACRHKSEKYLMHCNCAGR